jgi:hypothetical protein
VLGAWANASFSNATVGGDPRPRETVHDPLTWTPTHTFRNHPRFQVRNGAVPGTPSAYMTLCMEYSVDKDVDVVFSEYIV